jgi:tetratricopeptide (TPR) repeat protein
MNNALVRAQAALELELWEALHRAATEAIAEDPEESFGYYYLSAAESGLGRPSEALEAAREAVARRPDDRGHRQLLSRALYACGALEEAELEAREAVRLCPEEPDPWRTLAEALSAHGKTSEAITAATHGLGLRPEYPELIGILGRLLMATDPERSEELHRRALSIDADSDLDLNNLGCAQLAQRRPYEAALSFREALRVNPALALAQRNLQKPCAP